MADQTNETDEVETPQKSKFGLLGALGLFAVAAVAGVAVPFLLPDVFASESSEKSEQQPVVEDSLSNGMTYVPFGEVTVNLDEGRMNRYLRLKMSLQIEKEDQTKIEELLESKQLILRNWLLSHLSDKTLDEIRGKAGQNMLRREIRNYFNTALFSDGRDRIYDILFEEFNVQ